MSEAHTPACARVIGFDSSQTCTCNAHLAAAELKNIVDAQRFNRDHFANDTEFAEWVLSRARHTLGLL